MKRQIDRRSFLRGAGLLGVAAWVGPGVLRSLDLLPASAGTGEAGLWLPPFSEGGPNFRPQDDEESARYPTAVSVVVLADGRVLYWNGLEGTEDIVGSAIVNGADWGGRGRARVLDMSGSNPAWAVPTPEAGVEGDMFCSDQRTLADGRVVIAGGTEWVNDYEAGPVGLTELLGMRTTQIFDPRKHTFASSEPMHERRWYPSLVTLGDGCLLAFSGVSKLLWNSQLFGEHAGEASEPLPRNVVELEMWEMQEERWRLEPASASRSLPLYPRLHLLPSGKVLYTGAGQMWGPAGESYDEITWNIKAQYDPESKTWEELGIEPYGARSGAFSVLLTLRPPYDEATVLVGGGTSAIMAPGAFVATDLSELITQHADGSVTAAEGPRLANRRWFSTGVLLPDGTVAVFSGGDVDHVIDPGAESAIRMAELYDPATNAFANLSEGSRERTYHNSAALLPDGSVLVGGHSPLPAHYGEHGPSGVPGAANNYKDPSFEIYRPPYLFRGSRPRIRKPPKALRRGYDEKVDTNDASRIVSAVLVRTPAQTHTVDADQRAVELEMVEVKDGKSIRVQVPESGSVLPPGQYYLFLNASSPKGLVPSVAAIVSIA